MIVRTSSTPILILSSPEKKTTNYPIVAESSLRPRNKKQKPSSSSSSSGIRRVQSEGDIVQTTTTPHHLPHKKQQRQPRILEPMIPSFSLRPHQNDDDDHQLEEPAAGSFVSEPRNFVAAAHDEVGIGFEENRDAYLSIGTLGSSEMPVAAGHDHYRSILRQNPDNPLILRNYAQYLNSNRDLRGAEEYYSRAVLADPGDGEILSEFAKWIWELHGDKERAEGYFQRGVQAASQDSYVSAAYANFLWNAEEENEAETEEGFHFGIPVFNHQHLVK